MTTGDRESSSSTAQAVSRDRMEKLVARIDARRRYTLSTIFIATALCCAVLEFVNVSRTRAYGRMIKELVIQASSVDEEFNRTLAAGSLTGRRLLDAAGRAEKKMGRLHDRLTCSWTPRSRVGVGAALRSALEAHRRLYGTIRLQCDSDYGVGPGIVGLWQEARSAYSGVDRSLLPGALAMPAVTESDAARCARMTSRLVSIKRSVRGVRDYCGVMDGWIDRYNGERRRLQEALRTLRAQNPRTYESYQAISSSVRGRENLRQELNNITVPRQFGSVQGQFQAAIGLSIRYAQLMDRYGYAIYCDSPPEEVQYHQRQATPVGAAATRTLNRALNQYAAIRSRENFDPMKVTLNRTETERPPAPSVARPAAQPVTTRRPRQRAPTHHARPAGQRRPPPRNQEREEPPHPPPPG